MSSQVECIGECMFRLGAPWLFITVCYSSLLFLSTFFPAVSHQHLFYRRGGFGGSQSLMGEDGTVSGKACPKGLYGIFCEVVNFIFPDLSSSILSSFMNHSLVNVLLFLIAKGVFVPNIPKCLR